MGVPDTVTYEYMKRNEVFADAFNFLLYNGEKIIDHSELKELDAKTIAYIFNDLKAKRRIGLYRSSETSLSRQ